MQSLSSPQENSFNENKYSVLQGYNICLIFLGHLGVLIRPYTSLLDEDIVVDYDSFFGDTCLGFEYYCEWSAAIYRVKKIPKENQKNIKLAIQDVFLCTIELCKLYIEWWKSKLEYLINLLESMRYEPQKHLIEWGLWEKVVNDVINNHLTIADDFDWEFDIPEQN